MTKKKRYDRINGKALTKIKSNIRLSRRIVILGLLLVVLGFIFFNIETDNKNWPSIEGIVIESKVTTQMIETKSGSLPLYELKVKYKYMLDGQQYISDRVVYTGGYKSRDEVVIRSKQQYYSVNAKVTVYYNPDNPSLAVLEIGISWLSKRLFYIGGFISFLALFILIINLITERKLKNDNNIFP